MSNLIPLEEAARMLGLSVDKLNEMRSNSEIFGYKDGTSWKFKMQELERVAQEFDITINPDAAAVVDDIVDLVDDDDDFDIKLDDDEMSIELEDSVAELIAEDSVELEVDAAPVAEGEVVEDVIDLDDDDEFEIDLEDSVEEVVDLKDDEPVLDLNEDASEVVDIVEDDEPVLDIVGDAETDSADKPEFDDIATLDNISDDSVNDIAEAMDDAEEGVEEVADKVVDDAAEAVDDVANLAEESIDDALEVAAEDSNEFQLAGESDELMLSDDSAEITEQPEVTADAAEEELLFGSSDIQLAAEEDADDALSLADSGDLLLDEEPGKGDPSTGKLLGGDDADEGSDLMLSEEDLFEDDLEIHESHEDSIDLSSDFEDSSDLMLDDSDSSAGAEDDSGFLVADDSSEVDLSGGLMELAGADDEEADEMIVLDDAAPPDAPTELGDDDFNLTPLEEVVEEQASGSQVIALEDSEMFSDESEATLLSPSDELETPTMLDEDALEVGEFGGFDAGLTPGMGVTPGGVATLPEQPYTVWQIASLGLVLFLLLVGGMVGYDLARNLWLPEDQVISSGVLPLIRSLVGG